MIRGILDLNCNILCHNKESWKAHTIVHALIRSIAILPLICIQLGCKQIDVSKIACDTCDYNDTDTIGTVSHVTRALSVATDGAGNYYVSGKIAEINSMTGNYGREDCFINKYTASGSPVYQHLIQNTGGCMAATDAQGNLFVGRNSTESIYATNTAFIVSKYDAQGNEQFQRQFSLSIDGFWSYDESRASAVATDMYGNVYVVGTAKEGLDGNVQTGDTDIFLVKYDEYGTRIYTKQLGVMSGISEPSALATDGNGNIYITGITYGALDGVSNSDKSDMFLIKYDANGALLYVHDAGVASEYTEAGAIAADVSGNIFVVGSTTGALDSNALTGWRDSFISKFDPDGNRVYTRLLGAAGSDSVAISAAADSHGNVFVSGYTTGAIDGAAPTGNTDAFLAKYSGDGVKLFTHQAGYYGMNTIPQSLALFPNDNVIVAGGTGLGDMALYVKQYDNNGSGL